MQNFHKFDPSVLREYDIRGIINDTLTANDAHAIGSIFGSVINKNDGRSVVVGRDGRHISLEIEKNLIEGSLHLSTATEKDKISIEKIRGDLLKNYRECKKIIIKNKLTKNAC